MNSEDYKSNVELFLENRREALSRIIGDLEEKFIGISFDEEGNVMGNIEESIYYLNANRSADDLKLFIIKTDRERLRQETKEFEEKNKKEKENIIIAKEFLEQQNKYLKESDDEIHKLDVAILSSSAEDLTKNTSELVIQRSQRQDILEIIGYLNNEINEVNVSISYNNANIKMNKELVQVLTKEYSAIKAKNERDYINYEKLKIDLAELNNAKKVLGKVEQTQKLFKSDEQEKIVVVEDEAIEPETPIVQEEYKPAVETNAFKEEQNVIHLGPIPESEESKTLIVLPSAKPEEVPNIESIKEEEPHEIIPFKQETQELEQPRYVEYKEWKMDGFKLDFIEKFKYIPDSYERELNANYNGDYNLLRTNYGVSNSFEVPKEGIVVRIKNTIKSFVNSVKEMPSKRFASRHPINGILPIMETSNIFK